MSRSDQTEGKGEGDWECDDCGNKNFAWRNNCNRCSKSKNALAIAAKKRKLGTEIGKAAAEKSRGLFNADDWQCNKCANVNWARRQQCNVCNTPKFADMEERTGFGGGYNDRGVVEYKERSESDDEYDEFGRRKKRRRDTNNSKTDDEPEEIAKVEPPKPKKEEEAEAEEDEDEEEDDDGDLSKYDLTDLGDDNESKD